MRSINAMAQPSAKDFHAKLKTRLEETLIELDWTQQQMADALDVDIERYKKMHQRGRVPLYLIPKLALVTHRPLEYWIEGKSKPRLVRGAAAEQ